MNGTTRIEQDVEVIVAVDGNRARFVGPDAGRAFEEALAAGLAGLVEDLGVPARVNLILRPRRGEQLSGPQPFEVLVNGTPCRLPLRAPLEEAAGPLELAASVLGAVLRNRELILSPALAATIKKSWVGEIGMLRVMPDETFGSLAASLATHGVRIDRAKDVLASLDRRAASKATAADLFERTVGRVDTVAIGLELGTAQHTRLTPAGATFTNGSRDDEHGSLCDLLDWMRDDFWYELGLMLPKVGVQRSVAIDAEAFQIRLNDVRFPAVAGLRDGEILVNETPDRLALLGLRSRWARHPVSGAACAVLDGEAPGAVDIIERAALPVWDPARYVVLALSSAIRREAPIFLNAHHVRFGLSSLGLQYPSLVHAAKQRIPILDLSRLLRRLLEEQLGIGDLRGILENLLSARVGRKDSAPVTPDQADAVRQGMRHYISHKHSIAPNTMVVVIVDKGIEARMMEDSPLTEPERRALLQAVDTALGGPLRTTTPPAIVTARGARDRLRHLVTREFPDVAVLCYHDLIPDLNIHPVARVAWTE